MNYSNPVQASVFRRALLCASLGVALCGGPALALDTQPLDSVRAAAEQLVTTQLATGEATAKAYAKAGQLDPRLRLATCAAPLQAFLPASTVAARTTVGVRCGSPAWTVYVPVNVESELAVLVLRTAAARDTHLTSQDVEIQQRRVPGFPTTYLSEVAALAGRHLKMPASPGTVLTTELLAQDILVKRGQRVTLLAAAGGIEVRAQGEAISDANPAGRVKVLNLGSRRVVEGQVETADRVRVTP